MECRSTLVAMTSPLVSADSAAAPVEDRQGEIQAVILAAGYARRMQPLSDNCHKALLSVSGTTILGRIMDSLVEIGVRRVTLVTGYRAEDIEEFVRKEYPGIDLRLVHNDRFRDTNNIVSLSLAFDVMEFDRDVILVECDLLFDPSLMKRLVSNTGKNVALVDHYRTGMDGTVVEVSDGFVTDVYPTDTQGADFSYENKYKTLNIYRFDKDFCRSAFRPLLHTYANDIDSSCYYELVLGMLNNIRAHRVSAEIVAGERWAEVDDPNDLAVAAFQFEPERRSAILDQAFGGHWNFDMLDFSFMRNAYFPTGAMLANMRYALPSLIAGYSSAQSVLNEKLGYFLHCSPERVQVLHGASQVFPIIGRLFAGRRVTIPAATFGEYPKVFPDAVVYADAPGVDWDALAHAEADFDVVVVVNPNTSTGTTLGTQAIFDLARATPGTTFWVDESFLAFSDQPSLLTLLEEEPLENVAVLVSLSKCLGAPGLRLGYVYSTNRELVEVLGAELPVWNLSAPAEFLLELLLKFGPAYTRSLELTAVDRAALRADLEGLPFVESIPPSGGNFLLLTLRGEDASDASSLRNELLREFNIEVKNVSAKFPDGRPRLRVAVRTAEENGRLVSALRTLGSRLGED